MVAILTKHWRDNTETVISQGTRQSPHCLRGQEAGDVPELIRCPIFICAPIAGALRVLHVMLPIQRLFQQLLGTIMNVEDAVGFPRPQGPNLLREVEGNIGDRCVR